MGTEQEGGLVVGFEEEIHPLLTSDTSIAVADVSVQVGNQEARFFAHWCSFEANGTMERVEILLRIIEKEGHPMYPHSFRGDNYRNAGDPELPGPPTSRA